MRASAHRCRFQRAVSLLAAGELRVRRAARLRHHLENCGSCRTLQHDLAEMNQWLRGSGGLEHLVPRSFSSVQMAVRARIKASDSRPLGQPSRPVWPILAPLAGVVLMAAVLLMGGGRQVPSGVVPAMASNDGRIIHVSPLDDVSTALLTIQNGAEAAHRVAVSFAGPEFAKAKIYAVSGDRWVDPTPVPEPGQVVFYRVD